MEESLKIFHNKDLTPDEAMLKVTESLAHIGSWQLDFKTGVGKWSDETFRMIGYNPGDIPPLLESMLKQVHPDDLDYVKKAVENVLTNNLSSQRIEHRVINHKTKEVLYIETELVIDRGDKGEPLHALGFNLDVTSRKLAEQKLKQSETRFLASQHIAHIGCWEVLLSDNNSFLGKHEYWSLEKYRILGLDPKTVEPNGTNLLQVVHPNDRDLLLKKFNDAIQYDRLYSFDHRIVRADGSESIVHERGEVIMDGKSGNPLKMIGTIQDITERKKEEEALKESEANLRTIFDNTRTVYFWVNKSLKIIAFNKGALDGLSDELGRTLEVGDEMVDFAEDDKRQMSLEMYKRVFEGAQFKIEDSYRLANGTIVWFEMQLLPVYNDESVVYNMIIYLSDITRRKMLEIERDKVNNDLIQRNKDLEQFSYIISHNLRQPIANILGLTVDFDINKLTPDEQREVIPALSNSVKRLDEVIIDLTHILSVRNGESENKQMVKLSNILKYASTSLGFMIKKENAFIESDFSGADELLTVKSYMHSIFYNLISNSIKYGQPMFTPHIKIASRKQGNSIIITFSDNGLGIDLLKKGKELFGLYKRFHNHVNGKGMGLFMVKTQVESLGGKISVSSKVNKGTEFVIELKA